MFRLLFSALLKVLTEKNLISQLFLDLNKLVCVFIVI